jgi:hypothetical protein
VTPKLGAGLPVSFPLTAGELESRTSARENHYIRNHALRSATEMPLSTAGLTPTSGHSVLAIMHLCIINSLLPRAGVVQWQYRSFPSFGRGFDSHRPLQILKTLPTCLYF